MLGGKYKEWGVHKPNYKLSGSLGSGSEQFARFGTGVG